MTRGFTVIITGEGADTTKMMFGSLLGIELQASMTRMLEFTMRPKKIYGLVNCQIKFINYCNDGFETETIATYILFKSF